MAWLHGEVEGRAAAFAGVSGGFAGNLLAGWLVDRVSATTFADQNGRQFYKVRVRLARDRFGTLLALGVTVLFAVHVFVNIAMTLGLVPVTGIPLPFISYGGSFVLSCCLLQGLVQSVYRFRKEN